MRAPSSRDLPRGGERRRRSLLLALGLATLLPMGCSLWVGSELGHKPPDDEGIGGQGGAGGQGGGAVSSSSSSQSSSSQSSSSQSSSQSSSSQSSSQSSSTGGPMCPDGHQDCDGKPENGCEADLKKDSEHCGSCQNACTDGKKCKGGKCM